MGITELKTKHNERMINLVVTDIVIAGLSRLRSEERQADNALAISWESCFNDINGSSWDEIRSIIKRTL